MGGLFEDVERQRLVEPVFAGDEVCQGLAADVFHGDEAHGVPGRGVHLAVIEGGDDVGRVDSFSGVGLVAEAGEELLVVGKFRTQNLDGHFAVGDVVVGKPHGGHAAVADDPLQRVIVADEALQVFAVVGVH